jgi:hypothetical protein
MKLQMKIAMALGALALATGPAAALASQPTNPGVYCQDQSKKHVAGEKGTPFSRCVSAAAKLKKAQQP